MPIHDVFSSNLNLARQIRSGLDLSKPETTLPTNTLALLLDTLIDSANTKPVMDLNDSARKSVAAMIAPPILAGEEGRRRG